MLLLEWRPRYNQEKGQGTLNGVIDYHFLSLFARNTQLGYMKPVLITVEQDIIR